jgi:IS30 family transposase
MAHQKLIRHGRIQHYTHLTVFDRALIAQKHTEGMHESDIAKLIKRNRSTVIRELARHSSAKQQRYRPDVAHGKALAKRAEHGVRPRLKSIHIREYVVSHLKLGWSPEQIAIRLPIDHKDNQLPPPEAVVWPPAWKALIVNVTLLLHAPAATSHTF